MIFKCYWVVAMAGNDLKCCCNRLHDVIKMKKNDELMIFKCYWVVAMTGIDLKCCCNRLHDVIKM